MQLQRSYKGYVVISNDLIDFRRQQRAHGWNLYTFSTRNGHVGVCLHQKLFTKEPYVRIDMVFDDSVSCDPVCVSNFSPLDKKGDITQRGICDRKTYSVMIKRILKDQWDPQKGIDKKYFTTTKFFTLENIISFVEKTCQQHGNWKDIINTCREWTNLFLRCLDIECGPSVYPEGAKTHSMCKIL